MNEKTILTAEGIFYSYDKKNPVLKGVDIKVFKNEILTLYGPSGSGKSTLIYILGGLLTQDAGKILYNIDDKKKKIGFVFQNYNMLNELTVFENCKVAQNIRSFDDDRQIFDYADKIGITDILYRYPTELSVGQLQRSAVLRSICGPVELVFCDEPTGSLDSENKKNVFELFFQLKEYVAFFVVSHDEVSKKYADRVLNMSDGIIL
ncbi:MAG TPA: ATP-binding cassette domain-containing protein [Petrotogaceae bacterium]|jgi:ABC-type lipoprotein export system ATPase subunit|nr:ATP-binding cassette domain-containing protein [Petrotogaceae bacterium]